MKPMMMFSMAGGFSGWSVLAGSAEFFAYGGVDGAEREEHEREANEEEVLQVHGPIMPVGGPFG
jgi:hypothetical protein